MTKKEKYKVLNTEVCIEGERIKPKAYKSQIKCYGD